MRDSQSTVVIVRPQLQQLLRDTWVGRSILRSIEDTALAREVTLRGLSVDLGGGSSAYLARLRSEGAVKPLVVDLRPDAAAQVLGNFEQGLPFLTGTVDTVLLHNVLEHVYGSSQLLHEIRRVLRVGGCLYFSIPFLMPVHEFDGAAAYGDYHRYTHGALRELFRDFARARILALEVGPFLAAAHLAAYAIPLAPVRGALVAAAYVCDWVYERLRRRRDPRVRLSFVLGYVGAVTR